MSTVQHSVDGWISRLETRSLEWLLKQRHPCARGHNGKEHDDAIDILIERKTARGERVAPRTIVPPPVQDEEEQGEVQIIRYGGKGGGIRVRVPSAFS